MRACCGRDADTRYQRNGGSAMTMAGSEHDWRGSGVCDKSAMMGGRGDGDGQLTDRRGWACCGRRAGASGGVERLARRKDSSAQTTAGCTRARTRLELRAAAGEGCGGGRVGEAAAMAWCAEGAESEEVAGGRRGKGQAGRSNALSLKMAREP